jgi:hypothetical protein
MRYLPLDPIQALAAVRLAELRREADQARLSRAARVAKRRLDRSLPAGCD